MKVHPNANKIGNPTSQYALMGLKLVQLSALAGRIFFCHSWKSSDGVGTEYIRSIYGVEVRTNSVLAPCILRPNFSSCDKKKILPASVLNWTNFQPNRAHWLVGFPILVAFEGIGGVITLGTWGGGYWFLLSSVNLRFWRELVDVLAFIVEIYIYLDLYFKKE